MTTADKLEAERIARELASVDDTFACTGQPRLNPQKLETMLLAKACQIFQSTLEADPLTPEQRAIKAFSEAL